jgi:DNA-nicking Smr family endonuclease
MTEHLDEESEVVLEIDGSLDLHQFSPRDVKTLVPAYLEECRKKGIYEVRIIHGKGKGVLRRTVHAILGRLDYVVDFRLDDKMLGNWGATVVRLNPSATDCR